MAFNETEIKIYSTARDLAIHQHGEAIKIYKEARNRIVALRHIVRGTSAILEVEMPNDEEWRNLNDLFEKNQPYGNRK